MQPFLVITALVTTYLCYVEGQSSCTTPSGGPGQCKPLNNCAALWALVNKPNRNPEDTELLRKSHCGFQGQTAKVCCPDPCYTPDGKEGQCTSVYSCKHIVNLLKPPVPQHVLNYVQNSRCEGRDQYSVCCGPAFETLESPEPGQCTSSPLPPAPSSECCGVDSGAGNKIFERCNCILPPERESYCCGAWSLENEFRYGGGNATGIDQYPWLTLIEYRQKNQIKLFCGASLISARYVLTAGHCVAGEVLNLGKPINVRLGEYDTTNDGPDCVDAEGGGLDCNAGVTVIPIEKTIPHPDYNPYHSQKRHDIALIRLAKLAPYTDFIRPICLPTTDITVSPPPTAKLPLKFYAAGWGAVNDTTNKSNVKLHVALPYVANSVCQAAYKQPKRNVPLWNGQLCAGGEANKDSCKGDSGGPLMFENGKIYEIIGIVSFGPVPCGLENIPGVYTKVFEYNAWMRSVMRP